MKQIVYTIGYSNRSLDDFIELLSSNGINALCDVRSHPYSRFNPHFNKEYLKDSLEQMGITYVFLGKELGARPDDPSCYKQGKAEYSLINKTAFFQRGIRRIEDALEKNYRPALMCAEKDPIICHRAILIGKILYSKGIDIVHIVDKNKTETHHETEERLLKTLNIHPDLFQDNEQNSFLERAYSIQADKIAFIEKSAKTETELPEVKHG